MVTGPPASTTEPIGCPATRAQRATLPRQQAIVRRARSASNTPGPLTSRTQNPVEQGELPAWSLPPQKPMRAPRSWMKLTGKYRSIGRPSIHSWSARQSPRPLTTSIDHSSSGKKPMVVSCGPPSPRRPLPW